MGRRANGEGTYIKLKDGRYRLVQQVGVLLNGRPRRLTVTGQSKSECRRLMKKRIAALPQKQDAALLGKGTVENLCRKHLEDDLSKVVLLKGTGADRRECTINNQIAGYPIASLQVMAVTSRDVECHIDTMIREGKLTASSIDKAFDALNGAFRWGIENGALCSNPCEAVKKQVKTRIAKLVERDACAVDVIVLSEDERKRLIDYVESILEKKTSRSRVGAAVLLMLYTGMRVGELCALHWGDVWHDPEWKKVIVTIRGTRHYVRDRENGSYEVQEGSVKNAHARSIELGDNAIRVLRRMHEYAADTSEDSYVHVNAVGKPTNPSNIGTLINKLYRAAGLPKTITGAHILRRTYATEMYCNGAPIKSIAAYIGDLESTAEKYYIAIRKPIMAGNMPINTVPLPVAHLT